MSKFAVPILLFGLLVGAANATSENADKKMDTFRLPKTTSPLFYELQFTPRFNGFNSTFTGVANITVSILQSTNVITLNSNELNVTKLTVTEVSGKIPRPVEVIDLKNLPHNEQLEIHLKRAVPSNKIVLVSLRYEGKIRTDMTGLYVSSFVESNVTKWLAVTQFEATHARTAFPCYDEPAYKVPFNISVVKHKNHTALSNMPVLTSKVSSDDKTETVYFETTPPMSTYLAAIFVGEFVPSNNDSLIKLYTHADYANQTKYVDTEAPKHMNVLENYTGIKYMLPKMDLLAIPDFRAGAMENWGLNTYQEYYMLLDDFSKTRMKIRGSAVVQHEFVHQWFGNLVTCEWWDYTWLNEGFARYFQYFATKMVRTTWPMEEWFVVEAFQTALAYDQIPRHPITASVNSPDEIDSNFDTITYSKAAAVLRMLKHLVTENLFQKSIQTYLSNVKESGGVAKPEDLFASFDDVLDDNHYKLNDELTAGDFMSNWTTQSGYPLLYVTKNKTSNTYILTQRRFFINKINDNGSDTSAWHIGITYTTEKNKNFNYTVPSAWTNRNSHTTVIPAQNDSGWYLFNVQAVGFYRVNYDVENWNALIKQLHEAPEQIHVLNRAQLIDDAFSLAKAGQLNYTLVLNLTKYLKNENSTIPWYSAMNGFSYLLERMPRDAKAYENIKAHARRLAGTIYKKLETLVSKGNTDYAVKTAWDTFSTWALRLDDKNCNKTALAYFQKWHKEKKNISPDIKDAAFCAGLKNADHAGCFNMMFKRYLRTNSISEKYSAQSALGCSNNRSQLAEYVHHILDGPQGPVKEKDYGAVISAVSVSPLGIQVLHEFLRNNLNNTLKTNDGESTVKFIYSILASKAATHCDIEKLRYLKDNTTIPDSVRSSFNKSFEKINENLNWFDLHSKVIGQWAEENQEPEEEVKEEEQETEKPIQPTTTEIRTTTVSPAKPVTTTIAPKPTSGASTVHGSLAILIFTVLTLLIKTHVS